MKYIDVQWLHSNAEHPTRLVSELGPDRFETRKIEFWADGRIGYASKDGASRDTLLSDLPVFSIKEINAQGEFFAKEFNLRATLDPLCQPWGATGRVLRHFPDAR
jgi:hypothetical protein